MPTKINILDFTDLGSINESTELFPRIYNEAIQAAGQNTSPAFEEILTKFNNVFTLIQRKAIKQQPMNAAEADAYTNAVQNLNSALSEFPGHNPNASEQEKNAVNQLKESFDGHDKRFNEINGYFRKAATKK